MTANDDDDWISSLRPPHMFHNIHMHIHEPKLNALNKHDHEIVVLIKMFCAINTSFQYRFLSCIWTCDMQYIMYLCKSTHTHSQTTCACVLPSVYRENAFTRLLCSLNVMPISICLACVFVRCHEKETRLQCMHAWTMAQLTVKQWMA